MLRNEHKTHSLVSAPEPSDCKVSVATDQEQDRETRDRDRGGKTGKEEMVDSSLPTGLQPAVPTALKAVGLPPARSEANSHKVKGT